MKPIVHLYTICWNEEKFLEFFFRHYDSLVDEYHFYDDRSDDHTLQILTSHPKVHIYPFETTRDSYVLSAQELHKHFWKSSRNRANWVIITPVDELLYHPNLGEYLAKCSASNISAIPALGFQMISRKYPQSGSEVTSQIKSGAFWKQMNKLSIFDPVKVQEVNYAVGRHSATPEGNIQYPERDELLNLHYKYLSLDQTFQRHRELGNKLRGFDKKKNWGHKYSWEKDKFAADWNRFEQDAIDNIFNPEKLNPYLDSKDLARWWRNST